MQTLTSTDEISLPDTTQNKQLSQQHQPRAQTEYPFNKNNERNFEGSDQHRLTRIASRPASRTEEKGRRHPDVRLNRRRNTFN